MKHGVKFTFEEVKDYIENISNSGCKLISEEYLGTNFKLILKCKCGEDFSTTFHSFLYNNKRQCNACSGITYWNIDLVKEYIKSLGYSMVDDVFVNSHTPFTVKDSFGYYYRVIIHNLKANKKPKWIDKSNPYTIQNIKLWCVIKNKPFELISEEYINAKTNLQWKCLGKACEHVFEVCWDVFKREDKKCPYCKYKNKEVRNCLANKAPLLIKEWDFVKNDNITPYNITYGTHKKVWWQCSKNSQHKWQASVANRYNGNGCPYCSHQLPSEDYNLFILYPRICEEWDYTKNERNPKDFTPGSNKKAWWKCKECNYEWKSTINKRTRSGQGCPKCNESKGEQRINKWLTENNIPHDKEYTFSDLIGVGGGLLRFDIPVFWNHDKSLIRLLIEYDGGQHYKWVKEWQTKDDFNKLQIHDKMKDRYCEVNNIKLIRIPYYDYDNIEKILSNNFA